MERYDSLDGMRAWSCIMIVMAHIYLNATFNLGHGFERFALLVVELVFLFMVISGFSLCCGYYEKFANGTVSLVQFYQKRYSKVWPFWAGLVLMDVVLSPSKDAFYEAFADLTLLFGLLPNADIKVIGVGWFLGVVFVFYLVFPFLCCVLSKKKMAWCALGISVLYHIFCIEYFFDNNHMPSGYYVRTNFVYCMMFFVAGCVLYLYRDLLVSKVKRHLWVCRFCLLIAVLAFIFKNAFLKAEYSYVLLLVVCVICVIYGMGASDFILCNRFVKIISKYSLEIYLAHMVCFRVIEKMGLLYVFGNETLGQSVLSYVLVLAMVLLGTLCFSRIIVQCIQWIGMLLKKTR